MASKNLLVFVAVCCLQVVLCDQCTSPEVKTTSFTTSDATVVTNIAYITEFSVKCTSGQLSSLYVDLEGTIMSLSTIGPNMFQVSWTEEIKTARSGDRLLRIFNEDGFTALRKSMRAGEDTSKIEPLFTVTVNHPGSFTGPWLKSEFLAATLSVIVAYLAISSKSKLLS